MGKPNSERDIIRNGDCSCCITCPRHGDDKAKLTLIAAITALSVALPAAAQAQSAYTTGTIASSEAAGYPSPYGYESGLYAYAPDYGYGHAAERRAERRQWRSG